MDNPPADLQSVLRTMNDWDPMHTEADLISVSSNIQLLDLGLSLPHDVNAFPFSRYSSKYIRDHRLGFTDDPIRFPFLTKFTANDNKDSVDLFRLILSFIFDRDPNEERHLMLGNYITQKGLSNEQLRDEIYVQLVNQTIGRNPRGARSSEATWTLLASCLSVFPPSTQLANHLLKYVSDGGADGFDAVCQHKLLQCIGLAPELTRSYPPCLLEWTTSRERAAMALHASFFDGERGVSQVESWTTAEDFAVNIFRNRHVTDRISGWTVQLRDDVDTYECAGYDYVIDLISEMELPPYFPCTTAYFLTMTDISRPASVTGRQRWPGEPHNTEHLRLMPLQVDELAEQPIASIPPPVHQPPPPKPETPPPPPPPVTPPPERKALPMVVEEPSPPPSPPRQQDPIRINPEDVYIRSEGAISQGSALNKRKEKIPQELSKNSALNSRYATNIIEPEPEPEPERVRKPPRQQQQQPRPRPPPAAPVENPAPVRRRATAAAAPPVRKPPEPRPRQSVDEEEDMGAWVDNVFRQALSGAAGPVQDLRNPQALANNVRGGGDTLPAQYGLGVIGGGGGGVGGGYGLGSFGLQSAMAMQPNAAFAQSSIPLMASPTVMTSPLTAPAFQGVIGPQSAMGQNVLSSVVVDPTIQLMQQQQMFQQQQQQQVQQIQQQHQQQQQLLQHLRLQQQQQMQLQQHAADLQAQLHMKELEKQVLAASLQAEMLKQQLDQIQGKQKGASAPPHPSGDPLRRQSFRAEDDAQGPPRHLLPSSANYSYLAPQRPEPQRYRAQGEVDESSPGGVPTLRRSYINRHGSFHDPHSAPPMPVAFQAAAVARSKAKGVKFVDEDDDEDESAHAPAPPSPPIPKKEVKKETPKKQAPKQAVPAVKAAVVITRTDPPPKPVNSVSETNGGEPMDGGIGGRKSPGRIGIKWPPEPERKDERQNAPINRLVITEMRDEGHGIRPRQSPEEVQQKINNRVRSAQEAEREAEALRRQPPPPAPVKMQQKVQMEEAGTQCGTWSKVDMATKKKELEKMLQGVQWGTQKQKDPAAALVPPPPAPPTPPKEEEPRQDLSIERLDNIRTVLHGQCAGPFYTYKDKGWSLEIKKEVFSPLENLNNPVLMDLVFAQIVSDVLSGESIRINSEDKRKMRKLLDTHKVTLKNVGANHKIQVKKAIVKAAKELPIFFCRLFPVNGGSKQSTLQMVGVSHSGVRLLARNKDVFDDSIIIFETIKFSEIVDVHVPKSSTLLMRLKGRNIVVYSKYATQMREMLNSYRREDSEIISQPKSADGNSDDD